MISRKVNVGSFEKQTFISMSIYLFEGRAMDYFHNFNFPCFSEFRYNDTETKLKSKLNGGWF